MQDTTVLGLRDASDSDGNAGRSFSRLAIIDVGENERPARVLTMSLWADGRIAVPSCRLPAR